MAAELLRWSPWCPPSHLAPPQFAQSGASLCQLQRCCLSSLGCGSREGLDAVAVTSSSVILPPVPLSLPLPLPSWHVTTSNAVGTVEQSGRHALCLARVCQTSGRWEGGICRARAGGMKTPPPSGTLTLIQPHPPTSCQTLQWVASSGGP